MIKTILLLACLLLPVFAQNRTMTFEGIPDGREIKGYYNGGPGGPLGVTFTNFWAREVRHSPTAYKAAEVMPFRLGSPLIDVPAGFDAVSFAYRSSQTAITFLILRQIDAQGVEVNLLNTNGVFTPVLIWIPPEKRPMTYVHIGHVESGDSHIMFDNLTFWRFDAAAVEQGMLNNAPTLQAKLFHPFQVTIKDRGGPGTLGLMPIARPQPEPIQTTKKRPMRK